MAPSSSMTRMRGFMAGMDTGPSRRLYSLAGRRSGGGARRPRFGFIEADGRKPPLLDARLENIEREHVARPHVGHGAVVVVDGPDGMTVDLEDDVTALDIGIERRADGVHAPHHDAAHRVG